MCSFSEARYLAPAELPSCLRSGFYKHLVPPGLRTRPKADDLIATGALDYSRGRRTWKHYRPLRSAMLPRVFERCGRRCPPQTVSFTDRLGIKNGSRCETSDFPDTLPYPNFYHRSSVLSFRVRYLSLPPFRIAFTA